MHAIQLFLFQPTPPSLPQRAALTHSSEFVLWGKACRNQMLVQPSWILSLTLFVITTRRIHTLFWASLFNCCPFKWLFIHSPNLSPIEFPFSSSVFTRWNKYWSVVFFAFLLRWGIMEYGWRALRWKAGVVMIESIQIPENVLSV